MAIHPLSEQKDKLNPLCMPALEAPKKQCIPEFAESTTAQQAVQRSTAKGVAPSCEAEDAEPPQILPLPATG
jgi:hypothetical protein